METNMTNTTWQLDALKNLNSSKDSSEQHSLDVMSKIDDIIELTENKDINLDHVKTIAFEIMDMMQHHDLNRQKVERVMNLIIDNQNITKKQLDQLHIKNISKSSKHIDSDDGENISDEELERLISSSK
jgi:hypothetical protein